MKKIFICILLPVFTTLLCSNYSVVGQAANSVRLTVVSGVSIPFYFMSFDSYENGVISPITTIFAIVVRNLAGAPVIDVWRLWAEAVDSDGDGFITGDNFPANTLPFSTIMMAPTAQLGCVACGLNTILLPGPGGGPGSPLVTGGPVPPDDPDADQIEITYSCGTIVSILGQPADIYLEKIYFTLAVCAAGTCYPP